ncbi:Serine/threonine-protein phosphatase 1 [Novipirellula aureliae]|uniref:Serine/threonine-protein phosphatase 1 n=1 Tax=Novipirellula aureliae TaxID=2527966 RepID=A0A5C6E3G3_9BACT|nr:metallophosphoesterase family protein [Novipirellula aureliae]TWU43422.1 Serine/threonine-protein phosphatase 1 [Novipirellula aureliae]
MSGRLIAIGDIHGCRVALEKLIEMIAPTAEDILVTLGDYVDRGPDSRGVVDVLIELRKQTQFVGLLGNHEEMMLEVVRDRMPPHSWLKYGGVETLESYGFDGNLNFLPASHSEFYDSLGDYFEYEDYFFTHAAYDPDIPLTHQPPQLLRWHSLNDGVPAPHMSGKTAVVGHTAMHDGEILNLNHLLCIDTYCYGGKWLSAIDMYSRRVWQVTAEGQVR